jgi:sirohydrochlorin ferrochelatase
MCQSLQIEHTRTSLLLIAHGSRQDAANVDLRRLADELRKKEPYGIVQASFLELARPNIDEGAARCVEGGAKRVIMVPYFLSAGTHVQRDLAAACERLSRKYPTVRFQLAEPLSGHPLLAQVVLERARQLMSAE